MRAPIDWQKYRKKFHAHEKIITLQNRGGHEGAVWHSAWLPTLTLPRAMAQVLQCQETCHYILSLIDIFIDRLSIHTWHKRKYK